MRGWSVLPSKPAAQLALFSILFFGTMIFWHWEAMLISYLATRVIVLPFNNIPELVSNTQLRILVRPGTSHEDYFKFSQNPDWQAAWIDRVQPNLEESAGLLTEDVAEKMTRDGESAWYNNYFATM